MSSLADTIDALLPQTQCGRCGYEACRPYAQALAAGECNLNRCPPGGEPTIAALATLLGRPAQALDPACGPAPPPQRAWIDPAACIGCTKCIQACPVDAIVGASKRLHGVIGQECNGCGLCVAPCPVDCIHLLPQPAESSQQRAALAATNRRRHDARRRRLAAKAAAAPPAPSGPSPEVQTALARARALLAARGA
ncbi:RnfABCDGE type electron transport complex subunit B [Immundisolibacter sp.]|uniref:RnfABCDGE type electron transport complex subunit B n=1 Tax=Immundisolibacter sp. TaxID=1934948 RepID=UPI002B0D472D|nr:RnfABCDGE type electron transport complex subunit B [Immundisolibacter sp.]MEA3221005.1 Ion-translocating oxidoreductase complex subunit B [Immundisolibacter sp.]